METLVIITKELIIEKFRTILSATRLRVENNPAGGLTISQKDGQHIFIEGPATDAWDFYKAENELDIILAKIENPVFYYCYYRGLDFARQISLLLFDNSEIIIDNDFGLIVPGKEWVDMIKSQPGWDWQVHV